MQLSDPIQTVILSAVQASDLSFYGAEWISGSGRPVLRVYIEKTDATQGGVSVDDCERASRQIGAAMDVEGLLPQGYVLEVSSPGLDRPLFTPEHYQIAVGQKLVVKLTMPKEGRRQYKGKALAYQEGKLSLQSDDGVHELAFAEIQSARVEPDFSFNRTHGVVNDE